MRYAEKDFHFARGAANAALAFGIGTLGFGWLAAAPAIMKTGIVYLLISAVLVGYARLIYAVIRRREAD